MLWNNGMPGNRRSLPRLLLLILLFLPFSRPALAEDTISGDYIEGAGKVTVDTQSWGEDCGPKPKSYSSKGGKTVTVQLKGDNLIFSDGNSTKNCWSSNTRLKRLSATKKGKTWTTVCETPENDSRYEHGEYTVSATENGLNFVNKSTYNWQLKTSICKAVITIRKSYTPVEGKKPPVEEPPPEEQPDAKPPDVSKCKKPGEITRIAVSPSNPKVGAGEKVCFSVHGFDDQGCRIPVSASLSMSGPKAASDSVLEGSCFIAGKNAALSEGTFRITAQTADGRSAAAKVEVRFSSIEDLIAVNLDPSNLSGQGSENASVPQAMPPSGFVVVPGPGEGAGSKLWIYVIAVVGFFCLAGVVLIFLTIARIRSARRKINETVRVDGGQAARISARPRAAPRAEAPAAAAPVQPVTAPAVPAAAAAAAAPAPAPAPAPPEDESTVEATASSRLDQAPDAEAPGKKGMWMRCDVCSREFEPGTLRCPYDGSELKPYKELTYQSVKGGMICPVCRRGFQKDVAQCPIDKVHLIPYSVFRTMKSEEKAKSVKTKICPVCGNKYDENEFFCGSDGSKLEPIQ